MPSLLQLLTERERAGVYRTTVDTDEIVAAAKTVGLQVFRVDLRGARGKSGLLERFANALRFPAHFGKNWDAFNDCLGDLAWLGNNDLIIILTGAKEFAAKYRKDFDTLVRLLESSADGWGERNRPFWALIHAPPAMELELPSIISV